MDDGRERPPADESADERLDRLEWQVRQLRTELNQVLRQLQEGDRTSAGAEDVEAKVSEPEVGEPEGGNGSRRASGVRERAMFATSTRPAEPGDSYSHAASEPESGRGSRARLGLGSLGDLRSGEWWLGRIGVGLLLFGIVLLFTYSVQRGWLTPQVQVGIGLAVGAALLGAGLYVYQDRRAFSGVLLGGGIGAFYITGFAAYQVHALASQPLVFGFMVAVTLLAFALSLRQDSASLSMIGAAGGLGTPFILYSGDGSLGGLVLYVCLILAGTTALYLYKGWTSLLAVSSVGGWSVLAAGYALGSGATLSASDRVSQQLGVGFALLIFWLAPVAREIPWRAGAARTGTHIPYVANVYTVSSPLLALALTWAVWLLSPAELGWVTLGGAGLFSLAAFALRSASAPRLSYTHALVALLLLTLAFALLLRGDALLIVLAAEAAVLHYVSKRYSDGIVSFGAHALFCVVALWLFVSLASEILVDLLGTVPATRTGMEIVVEALAIALAAGASRHLLQPGAASSYLIGAHIAFLALLWSALAPLPGGDGWVTVAWGAYAAGMLVSGLRLDRTSLFRAGMATLLAVVCKLFVIDLAQVEAIWRVLMFMGFGGIFLALSYYLGSLWRPGGNPRRRG